MYVRSINENTPSKPIDVLHLFLLLDFNAFDLLENPAGLPSRWWCCCMSLDIFKNITRENHKVYGLLIVLFMCTPRKQNQRALNSLFSARRPLFRFSFFFFNRQFNAQRAVEELFDRPPDAYTGKQKLREIERNKRRRKKERV